MAYLYKITNDINGKVYVGKTEHSIEKRFKEHCCDRTKRRCEKRPLYSAMNKYGVEHFHVELLEETDDAVNREIYWIEYYNSYHFGYNATRGGDGKGYIDHQQVIATYNKTQNIAETAKMLNIHSSSVAKILHNSGIAVLKSYESSALKSRKAIQQISFDGEILQTFPSLAAACAHICGSNERAVFQSYRRHIVSAASNKRKTAYGYKWNYV